LIFEAPPNISKDPNYAEVHKVFLGGYTQALRLDAERLQVNKLEV
jgi:hypothetical protein